jgi:hypothetical protein
VKIKILFVLPLLLALFSLGGISLSFASEASEDIEAGCRDGQTLVHRFAYDDYVCVDPSAAERWEELGLAEIVQKSSSEPVEEDEEIQEVEIPHVPNVPAPPPKPTSVSSDDSQCRDGYTLVYRFIHKDSICTSPSTANSWAELGLAEIIFEEPPPKR